MFLGKFRIIPHLMLVKLSAHPLLTPQKTGKTFFFEAHEPIEKVLVKIKTSFFGQSHIILCVRPVGSISKKISP
jgi:hypothetical protein